MISDCCSPKNPKLNELLFGDLFSTLPLRLPHKNRGILHVFEAYWRVFYSFISNFVLVLELPRFPKSPMKLSTEQQYLMCRSI